MHFVSRSFRMWSFRFSISTVLFLCSFVFSSASNEEGIAFLKENKEKEGVIELASGMQYKILNNGTGVFHPGLSTPCSCHYAGTLIDGTTFDSSYDRGEPTTFAPNQVIKGWTEAMQLMVVGDKWEMYIPSELAYGDQGSPPKIPGGSVLIFTMEILEILGEDVKPALKCMLATGDSCNEKEKGYIAKIASWDEAKAKAQLERIEGMLGSKTKADLKEWMLRRMHLLKQKLPAQKSEDAEEL